MVKDKINQFKLITSPIREKVILVRIRIGHTAFIHSPLFTEKSQNPSVQNWRWKNHCKTHIRNLHSILEAKHRNSKTKDQISRHKAWLTMKKCVRNNLNSYEPPSYMIAYRILKITSFVPVLLYTCH